MEGWILANQTKEQKHFPSFGKMGMQEESMDRV